MEELSSGRQHIEVHPLDGGRWRISINGTTPPGLDNLEAEESEKRLNRLRQRCGSGDVPISVVRYARAPGTPAPSGRPAFAGTPALSAMATEPPGHCDGACGGPHHGGCRSACATDEARPTEQRLPASPAHRAARLAGIAPPGFEDDGVERADEREGGAVASPPNSGNPFSWSQLVWMTRPAPKAAVREDDGGADADDDQDDDSE